DGSKFVVVDPKIRWFDAATGKEIASLDQQFPRAEGLALSADGLTVAVVGHGYLGGQISVFRLDAKARTIVAVAKNFADAGSLSGGALSPDCKQIAVGYRMSGALTVYDIVTGRQIARHGSAHGSHITALAFSHDGTRLATAEVEGTI